MKRKLKTYNEKEIEILNEISDYNIIYDETQSGPQEEPIVQEINLNEEK